MAEKKKLTTLSISEKVEILDRLKNGEKKENIMKEKKIGLRTLQRIKKAEEDIRRDAANILPSRKRKRTGHKTKQKTETKISPNYINAVLNA